MPFMAFRVIAPGMDLGLSGGLNLDAASPGKDQGCRLPNFNDDFERTAPGIGAHEYDSPNMKLGVKEYYRLYGIPIPR